MSRNSMFVGSSLPPGDIHLREMSTTSRENFAKHPPIEKTPPPHSKEWFTNAHFSLGTEDATRPIPTSKQVYQQPSRSDYPQHITKDSNLSHMPIGERRVDPFTTTISSTFKEPQSHIDNLNPHPISWLRATHFQNGSTAEVLDYQTTNKDVFIRPDRSAYPQPHPSAAELNKSSIPSGDPDKIRVAETSTKSEYIDHGPQQPTKHAKSSEWLRATHFSLGEDPRSATQSVFHQDFPNHERDAFAAKRKSTVYHSDIPSGDSHTRMYETTSKSTYSSHPGARPASFPNDTKWLKDTHFQVGDQKVNFDKLPDIVTSKSEYRAPDRDAILSSHVKKSSNISAIQLGDNREDVLKTRTRLDYPMHQSAIPNIPTHPPEWLRATHFEMGRDPSLISQSAAQESYQNPGHRFPDRAKTDKNTSAVTFGDRTKSASPITTSKQDYSAPPQGTWRGTSNPNMRTSSVRIGD